MDDLEKFENDYDPEDIELLNIQKEMLETIEYVDRYSWEKGTLGGLSWGIDCFTSAFEGLRPGLILVAGGPNTGKSALCLELGWKIALANKIRDEEHTEKAYVLYFSLDDNATEILPRIVASNQLIPINMVKTPKKYEDNGQTELLRRRQLGIEQLKDNIDTFKLIDAAAGTSIEHIRRTVFRHIDELKMRHEENYKLVVIVDNFHDISVEKKLNSSNEQEKWIHISDELSDLGKTHDLSIICTAELKKLGSDRRPRMEDLRETVKLEYEAKVILMCYNEVGMKGESANIYWNGEDELGYPVKKPMLEIKVVKNKFSSYKRRMYMAFQPEYSKLIEAPEEDYKKFDQAIT